MQGMRRGSLRAGACVGRKSEGSPQSRIAREGWVPEDPLLKEAREIVRSDTWEGVGGADELALRALRRGIEIGKGAGAL